MNQTTTLNRSNLPPPTMRIEKEEKRNVFKRSIEVVGSSQHALKKIGKKTLEKVGSSRRLLPVSVADFCGDPDLLRFQGYVKIHNERSPNHIFEVGYIREKKTENKLLCIGCTECNHRIFPSPANKDASLAVVSKNEKKWNSEEEDRVVGDMEEHVTKHYVTMAKIILWIIEAFFALIVNYYDH